MFSTKSTLAKTVSYIVISFFAIIIAVTFILPEVATRGAADKSTVAVVNGQKLHILDFLRYRDSRFGAIKNNKGMENYILDSYIRDILVQQAATKIGFSSSDERTVKDIRKIFKNQETGEFDPALLSLFLKNRRMSFKDFESMIKRDIVQRDFYSYLNIGSAISSDELYSENWADTSKVTLRYSFLSNSDLKRSHAYTLNVTNKEVSKEISTSKAVLKDPKTDRERIRKKIKDRKLASLRKTLVAKVNYIADKKGAFASAQAVLKGKTGYTKSFSPGSPLVDSINKKKSLESISSSDIFIKNCLRLKPGQSSRIIQSPEGLYIFTPGRVVPGQKRIADAAKKAKKENIQREALNTLSRNIMMSLNEKAKIIKNRKTN